MYGGRQSVGRSVLRAFSASNACLTRDEPSSNRVGGIGLAESRQRYVRGVCSAQTRRSYSKRSRFWQNAIDTARSAIL